MANFETDVTYAEGIGGSKLPAEPYGVVNNTAEVPVIPEDVIKGKDDPENPDGLSLPEDSYIIIDFGDRTIVNANNAEIKLESFGSDTQSAEFEYQATAYYENGTSQTIQVTERITSGNGTPALIDIDDINFDNKDAISFITSDSLKITGLGNFGDSDGFEVYEVAAKTVDSKLVSQEISDLIVRRNIDSFTGQSKIEAFTDKFFDQNFDVNYKKVARNGVDLLEDLGKLIFDLDGNGTISTSEISDVFEVGGLIIGFGIGIASGGTAPLGVAIATGIANAAKGYLTGKGAGIAIENLDNVFDFVNEKLDF